MSPLAALTAKQREVLDLLVQHKTSKEIARELGISPHTVDQRIQFAKSKIGAATRGELAQEYRRLCSICDAMTYENSPMAPRAEPVEMSNLDGEATNAPDPAPVETASEAGAKGEEDVRVVPEMFEGPYGNLMRIGAILMMALAIVFLALGGMAVFNEVSRLLGR
ncbi:MAG TPA: helix-turn-helix transcriptional regulator [Sphingomonadaceae bacterium]|nr:helix-turn-helix transcriptional regulator [Sphingomonadaceae bacterium]